MKISGRQWSMFFACLWVLSHGHPEHDGRLGVLLEEPIWWHKKRSCALTSRRLKRLAKRQAARE